MNKKQEFRGYCPECLSDKLIKVGHCWSGRKLKQEYRCTSCGRLTIKPILLKEEGLAVKPV